MKLILAYYKEEKLGDAWRKHFNGQENVDIVEADICQLKCDAIVSPANSFGFMDGGLDYFLSQRFGWNLQDRLQAEIASRPIGELLIGEALIISTNDEKVPWLISVPTMRVPMLLRQSVNAYLAMKALLVAAKNHSLLPKIETIAVPGLGTGCGGLGVDVAAYQMWVAYKQIMFKEGCYPQDFGTAQSEHRALNPDIVLWD